MAKKRRSGKAKWLALGCLGGCFPLLGLTAVLITVMASVVIPVSAVTDSISRYPGGVWAAEQGARLMQATGRDPEIGPDEVRQLREAFDSEMAMDELLAKCFRGAPDVRPTQDTVFVASKEERDEIIRYRDAKLNYNRQIQQYQRDYDRWRVRMADYQHRVQIAKRRGYRPDQIPPPPEEPQRPVRPPELPEKSYRMTAAERGGVSASADVDPALISIEQAAVPANSTLRDARGRATPAVNKVVDSIPKGTSEPVARLYLTVAFAGGVTGWKHFMAIMNTSGLTTVTDDQVDRVAASFFAPGFDLSPYTKAVDAAIISLLIEEQIEGDTTVAMRSFEDCRM